MNALRFGIIGNMGPEADELFQSHLRKACGATRDQDQISFVVIKNADIPDRTEFITSGGVNPVPAIVAAAKQLEMLHIPFAVMPCNTAHYFRDEIQRQTSVYIVDMLETVMRHIKTHHADIKSVGLLATKGTVQTGIYARYADRMGIPLAVPAEDSQEHDVHGAIYGTLKTPDGKERLPTGIKSGVYESNAALLADAVRKMGEPQAVILGCTELPLVQVQLEEAFPDITFIDPMQPTAERVVTLYKKAEHALHNAPSSDPSHLYKDDDIVTYLVRKTLTSQPHTNSQLSFY